MSSRGRAKRQARGDSRAWRGGLAALGVAGTMALGLVWPGSGSSPAAAPVAVSAAGQGTQVEAVPCARLPKGMPHHSVVTNPGGPGAACDQQTSHPVKRCTAGLAGSLAVGAIFGGPLGALATAAGAAVGCGASLL